MPTSPPRLLTRPEELAALAAEIGETGRLALDTEFVWERTYRPVLGVVQIATGRDAVGIDAVVLKDLTPLYAVLRDPAVPVVVHGGGQDLDIFAALMGAPIRHVVDTQIVGAFLGYGLQVGLASLLERVLGVRIRKDLTYSDWTRRPLRPEQLAYAVEDVAHLLPLHDRLAAELKERGRTTWVEEELRQLEDVARWAVVPESECYRTVKGWQRLGSRELAVLRALAAWREQRARRADVRPGFIASDIVLVTLAARPVGSMADLRQIRGLSPGAVDRHGRDILAAVAEGLACPEHEWPQRAPRTRRRSPAAGLGALLRAAVHAVAEREDIAAEVIASARDLEALAADGAAAEPPDLPLTRGWRRTLVGDTLLAIARGELAIRYDPSGRTIVTERPTGPLPVGRPDQSA